ncbi:MAG: amidohydrolase [Phycisphaerales bacterium]|nr:amidohydrolase [Phycisphaerales bacterium]
MNQQESIKEIRALVKDYLPDYLTMHKHLSQQASTKESRALFISDTLKKYGISCTTIHDNIIVARLEGNNPSKQIIGLYAGINNLFACKENIGADDNSRLDDVLDFTPTTCLLGVLRILKKLNNNWDGTVQAIFQLTNQLSAEEAKKVVETVVGANQKTMQFFGFQTHPSVPLGKIGVSERRVMASVDNFTITVKSTGGHAAAPDKTIDSVLVASNIVVALQQIIARNKNPFDPAILSIGSIKGGNTTNVIPNEVCILGTLRCFNEGWREQAKGLIRKTALDMGTALGAQMTIDYEIGPPALINAQPVVNQLKNIAVAVVGDKNIIDTDPLFIGNDCAYYLQQSVGGFYWIGSQSTKQVNSLHSTQLDADSPETVFDIATMFMALLVTQKA